MQGPLYKREGDTGYSLRIPVSLREEMEAVRISKRIPISQMLLEGARMYLESIKQKD